MRNSPATIQHMMQSENVPHCNVYLDIIVVYTDIWVDHINSLTLVFQQFAEGCLTINLAKCEFSKDTVTYLVKQVGHGQVHPLDAKVTAILSF